MIFRKKKQDKEKPKKRRFRIFLSCFVVLLILLIGAGIYYYPKYKQLKELGIVDSIGDVIDLAKDAVVSDLDPLALKNLQQTNGKTNILFLGVDARKLTDSYNTDSIMLISYNHETNNAVQISVPRDLEAKYKINNSNYTSKINGVFPHTYRITKSFDSAFENLGSVMEKITGEKMHYGVMINFNGFKKVIDDLGGIEIDVEKSFVDEKFPNDTDPGIHTVRFEKGFQKMDGKTALEFARSRYGNNGEGNDGPRAKRQQKVVEAIKKKFIEANILSKIDTVSSMLDTLGENMKLYKIDHDVIGNAIKAREVIKETKMHPMVLDYNFGSYLQQLVIDGGKASGFYIFPSDKEFKGIRELVQLFIANPFLLTETPKVKVAFTNSKKSNDYFAIKRLLLDNHLRFGINSPETAIKLEKPKTTITITPTSTLSPTPTTAQKTGTIYLLNKEKEKSANFYKTLLESSNKTFGIQDASELPLGLEKAAKDQDILIVIE